MRLSIRLESEKEIKLFQDYRRNFISILKQIGIGTDKSEKKEYKPYSFSVWFGDEFKIEDEFITGKAILFLFSSGDPTIITRFYNGIIELKKKDRDIMICKSPMRITDIKLIPQKKIYAEKIIFKSLGVLVLNNPEASRADFKKWYIIPTDNIVKFNECLSQRINSRYQFFTKKVGIHPIRLSLLNDSFIKETIVKHYGGYIRGFRGIFQLEGSPEILQFVYDYGFGIRTGQGFGLLEVVKQI